MVRIIRGEPTNSPRTRSPKAKNGKEREVRSPSSRLPRPAPRACAAMEKALDKLPWRRLHEHPDIKDQIEGATAITAMDLATTECKVSAGAACKGRGASAGAQRTDGSRRGKLVPRLIPRRQQWPVDPRTSTRTEKAHFVLTRLTTQGDTLRNVVRGLMYMVSGKSSGTEALRLLAQVLGRRDCRA